jgi:hypothetical protein
MHFRRVLSGFPRRCPELFALWLRAALALLRQSPRTSARSTSWCMSSSGKAAGCPFMLGGSREKKRLGEVGGDLF